MASKDKNVRKLTRAGKVSLAVTLPAEALRQLGWRKKQKVAVKKIKGGFSIRDYKSR